MEVKRALAQLRKRKSKSLASRMSNDKKLLIQLQTKVDELEHKRYLQDREKDDTLYPGIEDELNQAIYQAGKQQKVVEENVAKRAQSKEKKKQDQERLRVKYKDYSDTEIEHKIAYLENQTNSSIRQDAYKKLPPGLAQELKDLKKERTRRKNNK